MPFEDFKGFWKIKSTGENAECAINSIITFDQTGDDAVTVLCAIASFPYGEATGKYVKENNTIEVKIGEECHVIRMKVNESGTPEIALGPEGRGLRTGSWTAEDYVPGPPPPTGK